MIAAGAEIKTAPKNIKLLTSKFDTHEPLTKPTVNIFRPMRQNVVPVRITSYTVMETNVWILKTCVTGYNNVTTGWTRNPESVKHCKQDQHGMGGNSSSLIQKFLGFIFP